MPAVAATLVHFVGAVAMLCVLAAGVGALAVIAPLPIGHALVRPRQPAPERG